MTKQEIIAEGNRRLRDIGCLPAEEWAPRAVSVLLELLGDLFEQKKQQEK